MAPFIRTGFRRFIPASAFGIAAAIALTLAGCGEGSSPTATGGSSGAATTSAETVTMEFDVKGMFCEGCVFAVRSAIAELDGVASCDVSLADERAVVAVDDVAIESRILDAVRDLEFMISRRTDNPSPNDSAGSDG